MFFAWLPFEDLVRKFADNDLRVYFLKDALLGVAILGVLPRLHGSWRSSLGEAWLPTIGLFVFAVVLAVPPALAEPAQPVAAIHTRFLFAVLLPIGAYVARSGQLLEKVMLWLAILTAAVCVLGIVQAVVGPTFLNPTLETSTLDHLTVERTEGARAVLRPSGPFTDVSRFASFTLTSTALALGAHAIASTRARKRLAAAATVIGLVAAFASGSRASLIIAVVLVTVVTVRDTGLRLRQILRLALVGGVLILFGAVLGGRAGNMVEATADFLNVTLNPWSSKFELGQRVAGYGRAALRAVTDSGLVGQGTGAESLSQQYLVESFAIRDTESGWRSVAAEWGIAGFFLWAWWTLTWIRRAFRPAPNAVSNPAEPARFAIALYLMLFLTAQFSLGIGSFENYAANVFFWFLSGIVFSRSIRTQLSAATSTGLGRVTESSLSSHSRSPAGYASNLRTSDEGPALSKTVF